MWSQVWSKLTISLASSFPGPGLNHGLIENQGEGWFYCWSYSSRWSTLHVYERDTAKHGWDSTFEENDSIGKEGTAARPNISGSHKSTGFVR